MISAQRFSDICCRRTSEAAVNEVGAADACSWPYMVCYVPCCASLLTTLVVQVEHLVRWACVCVQTITFELDDL